MKKRILTLVLGLLLVVLAVSFSACSKPEYTATFMADDQVVAERVFYKGDTEIAQVPMVPSKNGYTGTWETYTLGEENITIKAVYTADEYTATFMADGAVVKEVKFTIETTELDEPAVPEKAGFVNGEWDAYELKLENFTINASYYKTVSSVEELMSMDANGKYALMCDLDLAGMEWTPLFSENDNSSFRGAFDGNGHTISNLTIKEKKEYGVGEFGLFSSVAGTVKNLGLVDVNISFSTDYDGYRAGALAGYTSDEAQIENCYSTGRVSISGTDHTAGGLVGWAAGRFERCYSEANVSGDTAGGLLGVCAADLLNCYATGNVSAGIKFSTTAGGLVGRIMGTSASDVIEIVNCYALGNVYAGANSRGPSAYAGGLVGASMTSHKIENCFVLGDASAATGGGVQGNRDSAEAGSIIGDSDATVENCYYPEGQSVTSSARQEYVWTQGTATAAENFKNATFLKDTLKFSEDVWVLDGNYPTLKK